jgi:flagellar biosynthetic protein FliP
LVKLRWLRIAAELLLLSSVLLSARLYASAPQTAGLAQPGTGNQTQSKPHKPAAGRARSATAASSPAATLPKSIVEQMKEGQSAPWAIVVGLTLLTVLPALLLAMTPMVRLLVVFHFLRQALGTQTAPSNQVLMGLALMMTWFLMQPVLLEVDQQALTPYRNGSITGEVALGLGIAPVKHYMLHYAREKDLAVFAAAAMTARPATREDLPLPVIVPAYILSELKAGFQIGAILFLPFLLVDLVVASVTTSIGMMQLPPVVISTPLKILLFVVVDGWNLLAGQLLKSF